MFHRSDFSHEHILITLIHIWFRLAGELRCKSHPCDLPLLHPSMGFALRASLWLFKFDPVKFVGSASQHKFIPDEFVFACPKQSNQKKRHPDQFAPAGFPHHSTLPTGRPDSPSGLDRTKSDIPVGFSLTKSNASANFTGKSHFPVKQRVGCNSEAYCTDCIRRITANA